MFCLFTYIEIIEKNRTISFVPTLLPTFSGWQDGTEYPRERTGRAEGRRRRSLGLSSLHSQPRRTSPGFFWRRACQGDQFIIRPVGDVVNPDLCPVARGTFIFHWFCSAVCSSTALWGSRSVTGTSATRRRTAHRPGTDGGHIRRGRGPPRSSLT